MNKDKIKGGLADSKSINDIANKHKVSKTKIKQAIDKGVKVELEHTSDKTIANEIAKDHVWEDPKYYDKLAKMETKPIKEDVNLKVSDETPESISVVVEYNGRNAGVITVAPSRTKDDTIEIVEIKFKKDYATILIISEGVKALWGAFKDINSIIVAPKLESVEFWNKLGFSRISKNYLISNRGH